MSTLNYNSDTTSGQEALIEMSPRLLNYTSCGLNSSTPLRWKGPGSNEQMAAHQHSVSISIKGEGVSFHYTPTVAIVTGAAKGIGRAIALRLADDGFNVAVNDIPAEQQNLEVVAGLIREKGRQAVVITGDVSVEADVEKLVAQTVEDLGGLDAMIANAGIGAAGPLSYLDVEQFDRILAVNVRGVMLCYKHAAKQMISQNRGGRLIAASSIFGKKGVKYCQAYCASKFAVRGLSQSFAEELLPHKITVNTYAPGVIRTDMTKSDKDGDKHGSFVKSLFTAKEDAPDADPEVVASLVSYLCKPEAYFINGQSMSVCGGLFIA